MEFESYRSETRKGQQALALDDEFDAVSSALFEGRNCTEASDVGRASVAFFPLGDGEGVLRHFKRGGWIASCLGNRYFGNRMLAEFAVLQAYHEAGGNVPQPLGVRWEKRGPLYCGAIATRRLQGVTLLRFLSDGDGSKADGVLQQAGSVVRQMHDYGLWHADLQVKNLMVVDESVWIIDFDNGKKKDRLFDVARARNLLRLRRSFEKHGLTLDNFAMFMNGYGVVRIPRWLDWIYRVRGASAQYRGGR